MTTISITGASGYLGKHLVAELVRAGGSRIKVLARSRERNFGVADAGAAVEVTVGDLRKPASLRGFLDPGCIVVNLAYLWDAGEAENLAATQNLLDACRAAQVGRLIHCSSAAVTGRVPDERITEATPCRPATAYGIAKLHLESAVIDAAREFDTIILRPTAVFGPEHGPLQKLAGDLACGNRLRNYLKSCLFGRRRMNLVHVANVVAAIVFLIQRKEHFGGDVFIVSDDDSAANNFADVERCLMRALGVPDYALPRLPLPPAILALLLRCLSRNNVNPRSNYDQGRLRGLGFAGPVSFESGLTDYATWYRSTCVRQPGGAVE